MVDFCNGGPIYGQATYGGAIYGGGVSQSIILDRLPTQFNETDAPKLREFFRVWGERYDAVAGFFCQLLNERNLDDAIGAQLDQWGVFFNISRFGQTDDEYRSTLKAKRAQVLSDGTANAQINTAQGLYADATSFTYERTDTAEVTFTVVDSYDAEEYALDAAVLLSTAAAGVAMYILVYDTANMIVFDSTDPTEYFTELTDPTGDGGLFAEAYGAQ